MSNKYIAPVAGAPNPITHSTTGNIYTCGIGQWINVPQSVADNLIAHGWIEVPEVFPCVADERYAQEAGGGGAVPEAPTDGNTYGRRNAAWTPVLPVTGGTVTGVTVFTGSNSLVLNGAAGAPRGILAQTAGANRWQMLLADQTPESGGDTGSNFSLNALNDFGAVLSTPLSINRATGLVAIPNLGGYLPLTGNDQTAAPPPPPLTGRVYQERASDDALGPWWVNRKARGAQGAEAIVQSGDSLGRFSWEAHNGAAFADAGYLQCQVIDPAPGATMQTQFNIWTVPQGGSAPSQLATFNDQSSILNTNQFSIYATSPVVAQLMQINSGSVAFSTNSEWLYGVMPQSATALRLNTSRGTLQAPATSQTSDSALVWAQGYGATGWRDIGRIVFAVIDSAPSDASFRSQMNLQVTPTGSTTMMTALALNDLVATFGAGINLVVSGTGVGNANIGLSATVSGTATGLFQISATGATAQATLNLSSEVAVAASLKRYTTDATSAAVNFFKTRGTVAAPAAVAVNDMIGNFNFDAYNGSAYTIGASIRATCIETSPSPSAMGSQVQFLACPVGSVAQATLLTLTDSGATFRSGMSINIFGTGAAVNSVNLQSETNNANFNTKRYSSDINANLFSCAKARGTTASPAVVATNDVLGTFLFQAHTGSSLINAATLSATVNDPSPSPTAMGTRLRMATAANGSVAVNTIWQADFASGMFIGCNFLNIAPTTGGQTGGANFFMAKTASGFGNVISSYTGSTAAAQLRWQFNFGDGTSESGSNAGSNVSLAAYSDAGVSLGAAFSIVRSTQIVTFPQPIVNGSDARMKRHIRPLNGALDIVAKLAGVSYNRIGQERREVGMLAQDVREALPEAVHESDGMLGIAYSNVVAVLVEAVKELSARLEILEMAHG